MKIPEPMKGELIPVKDIESTLERLIKKHRFVYASVKEDGYRCRSWNSKPYSSTGKLIPNRYIQKRFAEARLPDGLDGELIVDRFDFQLTQSGVTTREGEPDFRFFVFDKYGPEPFRVRLNNYYTDCQRFHCTQFVECVYQLSCFNVSQVLHYENRVLLNGHEGVMIRTPDGPYKEGKATLEEGYLLKLVRFHTAEARILGTYERCSSEGAEVPLNMLGGFYVRGLVNGVETDFKIGNGKGWTIKWRQKVWREGRGSNLFGKEISYTYKIVGMDKKPRAPIAKGIL